MDVLPNDLVDKIYFEKHKLDMFDVFQTIIYKKRNKLEEIAQELVNEFPKDPSIRFDIVKIHVALRHDGYINDIELKFQLLNLNEILYICFRNTDNYFEEIDVDHEIMDFTTTTDDLLSLGYLNFVDYRINPFFTNGQFTN